MCDHENSDIRDMVEVDKGRGLLGNLQVSKTKSIQRPTSGKKIVWKQKKFFRREKNITDIRDKFSGCDKPSPLKKNLVQRFED